MELMTAMRSVARQMNDRKALLADTRARAQGGVMILIDAPDIRAGVGRNGVAS
jgi:hypothetical protein